MRESGTPELKRILGDIRSEYQRSGDLRAMIANLGDVPRWMRSRRKGHGGPLQDRIPWIPYRARRYLGHYLKPGMKVFEWGSGGSTAWLLERGAHVVSVEHDEAWVQDVTHALELVNAKSSWKLHFVSPRFDSSLRNDFGAEEEIAFCRSRSEKYRLADFATYVHSIDTYPDRHFDCVMVDGRARPACLIRGAEKVAEGGILVLDNSDRSSYQSSMRLMDSRFSRITFRGLCPYIRDLSETTIWQL